jgi:uncharacterized membrane protein YhaH (DUF805 family)
MKQDTINISDIFFGSDQSKYAGIALFMTIIILCLIILFTGSKIPIGERFVFVLFILIISVPSILMSLFELTCIVTGGDRNTRWWCWLLAWFLSIVIILYCIMIIISMLVSMSNFEMANDRLDYSIEKNKVNKEDADMYAKNMLTNNHNSTMLQNENSEHHSRQVQYENMEKHVPQVPTYQDPQEQHLSHNSANSTNDQHMQQIYSSVNKVHEQNNLQLSKEPHVPSYSEPKHNINSGNTLSFPQNSSDLSGLSGFDDDKYLSIDKANISAINYSNEYKQPINNNISNYDGFDSDDKLSPY